MYMITSRSSTAVQIVTSIHSAGASSQIGEILQFCDFSWLHCALASCGAVYCNRSCSVGLCVCVGELFVCLWVCLWVCYHDNSKLHASILTKLGL